MDDKDRLLEQYKLYVETAETVSKKRQTANSYYLSINSFLLILSGYLTSLPYEVWHILIAMAGITISLLWIISLKSYRQLNSAKYKVIHKIENNLPSKPILEEWVLLGKGKNKKIYSKLSLIEQFVPAIFILLYLFALVLDFFNLLV